MPTPYAVYVNGLCMNQVTTYQAAERLVSLFNHQGLYAEIKIVTRL